VEKVVFSPDGELLASKARGGMDLWKVSDGSQIHMFEYPGIDVAFSPFGSTSAVANFKGSIALYSTEGSLLTERDGHARPVSGIVFSPNGGLLFTSSIDGTVRVWLINP
jgi:WD40 repeat protein